MSGNSNWETRTPKSHWVVRTYADGGRDFWTTSDKLWAPAGLRGAALTKALHERIRKQVKWALQHPELYRLVREHGDVEQALDVIFEKYPHDLLYGTVRRVQKILCKS